MTLSTTPRRFDELVGLCPTDKGGTHLDSSASDGVAQVTAGVWAIGALDLSTARVTGILPVARGGLGFDGSLAADGQLPIGNGSGFTLANLVQGPGILIANGVGTITISSMGPAAMSPHISVSSALAIAAGGSTTLQSDQVSSGKTASLLRVVVSSSVAFKVDLKTVQNGVASSAWETGFSLNGEWVWDAPGTNFLTVPEDVTAGLDGFQVSITNLDPSLSANFYVTFYYDEA